MRQAPVMVPVHVLPGVPLSVESTSPTPTASLKLRGSWRGNINRNEPKPESSRPRCPRWLNPDAKKAWLQLAPSLHTAGLLTSIDGHVLARYCQLWSRWRAAELFIKQHGDTYPIKNSQGQVIAFKAFPQTKIAQQLAEALLRLEQQIGLTPSVRSRITVSDPPRDAFDDFLDRKVDSRK